MPLYSYKARDKRGQLHKGEQEASHKSSVAARLLDDRLTPVSIEEIEPSIKLEDLLKQYLPKKTIPLDDLVLFCRQMHALTKSGIPIMRAVFGLAETTNNEALSEVLQDIGSVLSRGKTLSQALHQHENFFSPIFISMVHVGESTGNLDQAFYQLVHYLEMMRDTKKKVSSALRYPTMVIASILIALVVVNVVVIPSFAKVFDKFGSDLPLATQMLLATSHFFIEYWWALIGFIVSALFGMSRYLKTERGALNWDRIKLKLPIVGGLLNRICLSRFTRTFSMLFASGVPILQSIDISAESIGNLHIEKNVREMRIGIERGDSLSRTANSSGMFTPLILQMIAVGEESGALDALLLDVSEFYDEETDFQVQRLSGAIEPIMLLFMGAMILVLALGIFLPLWDLSANAR